MTDNVTPEAVVSAASFSFATDDIVSVHYPIIKLAHGALDSATIVSTSSGLPVQQQGTWTISSFGNSTTGPQKAEDVASANGDIGIPAMAVQKATPANTAGTDGDYEFLQMSAGRLWTSTTVTGTVAVTQSGTWDEVGINDSGNSITVDNGGTFAVQVDGAALTSLQLIDDAIVADDAAFTPATTKVMMAGFEFDDSTPDSVNEGDAGAARMSANRNIYVQIRDNAGNERGLNVDASGFIGVTDGGSSLSIDDGGNTITVDGTVAISGTVAATQSGTWTVQPGNTANTTPWLASIHDGTTKAEVLDLTTKNALAVAIVDTNGDQIASFGGGTQYTEDAAAAANPVGNAQILVRADTPAAVSNADGDNVAQRGTNYGAAYVQVVDSSGNFINTFGGSGGTASADDADFTATSTQGTPAMGVYESSPTNVTDGDMGIVGITQARRLKVDATGTVDLGATDNAVLDAIAASVAAIDTDATTIIGHVDGIEGLLTTIDADTGNVVTSVQLLDDTVTVLGTDTYTETTSKGLAIGAVRRDADTTLVGTTNEWGPLQMDANGRLKVEVFSGETLPVSGTVTANPASGTIDTVTTVSTVSALGNSTTGPQKAEDVASANADVGIPAMAVQKATPANTAGTDGDYEFLQMSAGRLWTSTTVDAALPAGTNAIGKLAANSGVDIGDVDVTSISAGTNNIGNVGLIPRTSGGMTTFRSLDIDETEEEIKATAGQVFSITAFNTTAAPLYLKFYNATAANVTVGTTTPTHTFQVPGNADSDGAGFVWNNEIGFAFGTAITVACTTAIADNDTGAPGANACLVIVGYA